MLGRGGKAGRLLEKRRLLTQRDDALISAAAEMSHHPCERGLFFSRYGDISSTRSTSLDVGSPGRCSSYCLLDCLKNLRGNYVPVIFFTFPRHPFTSHLFHFLVLRELPVDLSIAFSLFDILWVCMFALRWVLMICLFYNKVREGSCAFILPSSWFNVKFFVSH